VEAAPLPKFEPDQLGDCIDCTLCVQVCPVGIDIRNGLQYECIACGACIDACDEVMDKVGMPHGLIRYTTQHALDGETVHVVRPRILIYSLLLTALVSAWVWGVFHRSPLIADVLRDRNALYQQQGQHIANGYTLKLVNKTDTEQHYSVTIESAGNLALALKGSPLDVRVPAGEVVAQEIEVGSDNPITGRHDLTFVIQARDGSAKARVNSTFFGPI
jgi:cytochrome c oxidase accessory protein FixG